MSTFRRKVEGWDLQMSTLRGKVEGWDLQMSTLRGKVDTQSWKCHFSVCFHAFFDSQLRKSQICEVKMKVEAWKCVKTGVFCTFNLENVTFSSKNMQFFDGRLRGSEIYEVKVRVEARNTVKTGVFCTGVTPNRFPCTVRPPLLRRRKRRQKRTRRRTRRKTRRMRRRRPLKENLTTPSDEWGINKNGSNSLQK